MKTLFWISCCLCWVVVTATGKTKHHAPSDPIRVACVGNSITYGMGVENREQNSYPAVLGRLLGEAYQVRNFGHSGATLLNRGHHPYTQTQEYAEALAFRPDVVVIHLGINDTDPRNWPNYRDDFIPDYRALIARFREANPSVRVYVCRMTPISHRHRRFKTGTREWHHQIQAAIEQVASQEHAVLIDLETVLKPRPELLPDALHPNAEGARLMAERIYSAITGDYGGLRMSPAYADHMVLQRGFQTRIGGVANAGARVTVVLSEEPPTLKANGRVRVKTCYAHDTTTAGADGRWEVALPLKQPIFSSYLTIATPDTVALYRDVAVGDVWVACGQSNMSWPVSRSAERNEVRLTDNIRLFRMNPTFADERGPLDSSELRRLNQLDYIRNPDGWVSGSDSAAVASFSAVAWFCGQELVDTLMPDTPVGLIQTSLGGAPAEAFVERQCMEDDSVLLEILYDWRHNEMIQDWVRGVMNGNLERVSNPLQRHYFEPCYLYESRIAPLADGYDILGVLWYQGESNAHNAKLYERLFPAVVKSFEKAFGQPRIYFRTVQLPAMNRSSWPCFRESQRRLAHMLHNQVKMVTTIDLGDSTDVHPRRKRAVGQRLAVMVHRPECRTAPGTRWGMMGEASPEFDIAFLFDTVSVFSNLCLCTSDGEPPRTFELAGEDGIFYPAKARIVPDNRTILRVWSDRVPEPRWIRYGWQPVPNTNLFETGPYRRPVPPFKMEIINRRR